MSKKIKNEEGMTIDDTGNENLLTVSADSANNAAETFGSRSISLDKIIDTVNRASVGTIKILDSSLALMKMLVSITYEVSETLKANGIGVTTAPEQGTPGEVLTSTTRDLTAATIAARALSLIYEENAAEKSE